MQTDISKTTILILLVFTVVVSIMGTYTVLVTMDDATTISTNGEVSPDGQVGFSIIQPESIGPKDTTGEVSLSIMEGK